MEVERNLRMRTVMKYVKVTIKILLMIILCLNLVACTDSYWSETEAKEDTDELVEAMFNKDADALRSLISENSKNNIENLDEKIEKLMNFCEGEYVSHSNQTTGTETSSSTSSLYAVYASTGMKVTIKTTEDKYLLYLDDITSDEENRDNIGIERIEIVRKEDSEKSTKWLDRNFRYDKKKKEWVTFYIRDIICWYSEDLY